MLKEEDIILHGSTIVDSEGLLHGKYKSKHKSKSGKWVYVYEDAKKAVGGLFDKDVTETITRSERAKNGFTSGGYDAKQVKKKGSIHKGYDATVRALKGLVK